jgi:hypothetical protein
MAVSKVLEVVQILTGKNEKLDELNALIVHAQEDIAQLRSEMEQVIGDSGLDEADQRAVKQLFDLLPPVEEPKTVVVARRGTNGKVGTVSGRPGRKPSSGQHVTDMEFIQVYNAKGKNAAAEFANMDGKAAWRRMRRIKERGPADMVAAGT